VLPFARQVVIHNSGALYTYVGGSSNVKRVSIILSGTRCAYLCGRVRGRTARKTHASTGDPDPTLLDAPKFMVPSPERLEKGSARIENGDNGVFRLLPSENKAEGRAEAGRSHESGGSAACSEENEENSFRSIHLTARPSCRIEMNLRMTVPAG